MFLDEATITVHGGKGGKGLVSWRKEKYVPRGGPWGGDGGNGGNVLFLADNQTDTLTNFSEVKVFQAEDGEGGGRNRRAGKRGEDLVLRVPPGTIIADAESGTIIADLTHEGESLKIARGGRGGYGNAHFATSIRQAPDFAEMGEPGETKMLHLTLKLVAEVGIIGFPSVGKSTIISVISAAKPKIADYPFTTLVPNLGVVTVHDRSFIACDVPGLIEGASEGKGLGDTFLRHIERCGALVHVLDISRENIVEDYRIIRKELQSYSPTLAKKRELVILNKVDLIQNDASIFVEELKQNDIPVFAIISSATLYGIQDFLNALLHVVLEERKMREAVSPVEKSIPVLHPHIDDTRTDAFTIDVSDGVFHVSGSRIEQIAAMTNWESFGGVQRFRDICERIGLKKALERSGATEESTIFVGKTDVSEMW
ncbi:MAG TPA: GTPase ObgE [Candidatus Peribacterales bacterium]|nr:GTPase ObgE [Candidatus Peribacterales bacterium]